jgi:hypothetical protein
MRLCAALLSALALAPAMGQSRGGGAKGAGDIMDFIVQSQMVEFRPSLNRDPFAVPSEQIVQNQALFLIDELTVKGRIVVGGKPYAIILDAMQNARYIPVGFRLLDGQVTEITENAVIFDQWDAASQGRSGKRSVTKHFKREEEKR